jgi:hypothetical protein
MRLGRIANNDAINNSAATQDRPRAVSRARSQPALAGVSAKSVESVKSAV